VSFEQLIGEHSGTAGRIGTFETTLVGLGRTSGRNLQIEYRWARGDPERSSAAAAYLAALAADVLVAVATPACHVRAPGGGGERPTCAEIAVNVEVRDERVKLLRFGVSRIATLQIGFRTHFTSGRHLERRSGVRAEELRLVPESVNNSYSRASLLQIAEDYGKLATHAEERSTPETPTDK
jgi:hypothetical protein